MEISKIIYKGDLRTEATHLKSGETIITDAPVDNKGKGMAFSPTDLVCTALGSCMLTIMGISAQNHAIDLKNVEITIGKHMGTEPRRIVQIDVSINLKGNTFTDKEKKILEHAAMHCPVAKSLSAEIIQKIDFVYSSI